jgi:hypothetical protein
MKLNLFAAAVLAVAWPLSAAAHEHHAPHKGILCEFGEEFAHVELVLDPADGTLTVYALDGEAEKPVRLKQKELKVSVNAAKGKPVVLTLKAQANGLTGETVGDTSEFSARDARLKGIKAPTGKVVSILIKGKAFKNTVFPEAPETEGKK